MTQSRCTSGRNTNSRCSRGFTLLEISIVLVIIALIVGGVLVARDLIKAAQIRSIVAEHQQFASRWNVFEMKYSCIPGDCPNATRYFAASGTCPSFSATTTCNGNGNDWIEVASNPSETVLVWNHLNHASLTEGWMGSTSLGTPTNAGSTYYLKAPEAKGLEVWTIGSNSTGGWAQMYPMITSCQNAGSNMIGAGLQTAIVNTSAFFAQPRVAVYSVSDAADIDTKMDDGMPCNGRLHVSGGRQYNTATMLTCITGTGPNASFDFTQPATEARCRLVFKVD